MYSQVLPARRHLVFDVIIIGMDQILFLSLQYSACKMRMRNKAEIPEQPKVEKQTAA